MRLPRAPGPPVVQILRPAVSFYEGGRLRELLAAKASTELTDYELRTVVRGNITILTPKAFFYFLPAFMHAALESYTSVSVFAWSLLVPCADLPARTSWKRSIELLRFRPVSVCIPGDVAELLRKQQLEWFDSGIPAGVFHERFDSVTNLEGAAILSFFDALRETRGADFPFGELETAVSRYWARYRVAQEDLRGRL